CDADDHFCPDALNTPYDLKEWTPQQRWAPLAGTQGQTEAAMSTTPTFAQEESPELCEGVERRQSPRYECHLETSCQAAAALHGENWPARVKDLSRGGAGLLVTRRFEPGTLLGLTLPDGTTGEHYTVLARVIHAHPQECGDWLLGCAFADQLTEEELQSFRIKPIPASQEDCRAWVRFPSNLTVTCRLASAGAAEKFRATVFNISPGGIGLGLPRLFERGTMFHVDVPIVAGRELPPILVRVVHPQPQNNGVWRLGCEFATKLTDEQLAAFL